MPDDQHLPAPGGNRQQARHAAESYAAQAVPDEQPTEYAEPTAAQPDMPDPDQQPGASTPGGRQFAAVPAPPTGASANLQYILSVVADPKHREAIEQFAYQFGDRREDHMLTAAAAMATAILENHIDRGVKVHNALDALFRTIAQEAADGTGGGAGYDLDTLREVFRDEAAEGLKIAYRLGFRTALMFAGGGVVVGLLLAFIIHVL